MCDLFVSPRAPQAISSLTTPNAPTTCSTPLDFTSLKLNNVTSTPHPPEHAFSYLTVLAIGSGFFGLTVVWALYNAYMPLLLGAFIDSRALRGAVMGLDNAFALLLIPIVGAWSDGVKSPLGQRLPFIVVGLPLAALFASLLPLQTTLWLLLGVDILFLLAMTLVRAPIIALMPDHTPPEKRASANGVINLMGGLGGILAFFVLAPLFDISPRLPFWLGGGVLLLALLALWLSVERQPPYTTPSEEAGNALGDLLRSIKRLAGTEYRTARLTLLAIGLYFVGFSGLEAQFSTYATETLGLTGGRAGVLLGVFSVAFVLFALPAGLLGNRVSKARLMLVGLGLLTFLFILIPLLPSLLSVLLFTSGLCWALVNVSAYALVADLGGATRIGFFTGMYYLFSMTGAVIGPGLIGLTMDTLGPSAIFWTPCLTFLVAAELLYLGMRPRERGTLD